MQTLKDYYQWTSPGGVETLLLSVRNRQEALDQLRRFDEQGCGITVGESPSSIRVFHDADGFACYFGQIQRAWFDTEEELRDWLEMVWPTRFVLSAMGPSRN